MAHKPTSVPSDPRGKVSAGRRFGLLVVQEFVGVTAVTRKHVWTAQCDCGGVVVVRSQELLRGDTNSCGCLHREALLRRNRERRKYSTNPKLTPAGVSWRSAIDRCCNPRCKDYPRYGGRGITICDEWRHDFEQFLRDLGPRPPNTSLERIDVNGPYAPGNCRWATAPEQAMNRRNTKFIEEAGHRMIARDWGVFLGVSESCVAKRLREHGSVYGSDARRKGKGPDKKGSQGEQHMVLHAGARADKHARDT